MESLPLLLFGMTTIVAGLMSLHFPETLNTKLPDTMEDAEALGQQLHANPNVEIRPESYTTVVFSKTT